MLNPATTFAAQEIEAQAVARRVHLGGKRPVSRV